jgi:hypothetical protein
LPLRPIVFTAVCAALWLAFTAWSDWSGDRKLRAGALEHASGPLTIEVTLAFVPEPFHMTRLQQAGRMIGVQDRTIRLADVSAESARDLAREYWVTAVRTDPR